MLFIVMQKVIQKIKIISLSGLSEFREASLILQGRLIRQSNAQSFVLHSDLAWLFLQINYRLKALPVSPKNK
jgi:hypothetical protein